MRKRPTQPLPPQGRPDEATGKPGQDPIRVRFTIAFDGTRYAGWQAQKTGLGVQQRIEEALKRIFPGAGRLQSSSRTDTGVHAIGMAAHVEHLRRNQRCSLSDGRLTQLGSSGGSVAVRRESAQIGTRPGVDRLSAVPKQVEDQPVTADDLARWRRQLLRIFDGLDGRRNVATVGPGGRLNSLREAGRIPRHVAAFMKVVLEARNTVEYDNRELSRHEAGGVKNAWAAISEWAGTQGLAQ